MGCDIHVYAESKNRQGLYTGQPAEAFSSRSYGTFGFLAGVRNYSGVKPISEPRGIPGDASAIAVRQFSGWGCDAHTPSWLTIKELAEFDYDAMMEDRRVTRQTGPNSWNGGCTAEPGEGETMTWREFLGDFFFEDLKSLAAQGVERIVFWFDN